MEITIDRSWRHWWMFLIRGILFILLAIYLFCEPASGYLALSFLLGAAILITGITELLHSYQHPVQSSRGRHLAMGIIEVVIGLILVSHLAASEDILRILVGIWLLLKGFGIFGMRGLSHNSWLVNLSGLVVIIMAVLIIFNSAFGMMTIILWTGIAFLVTGIMNVLMGVRMRPHRA